MKIFISIIVVLLVLVGVFLWQCDAGWCRFGGVALSPTPSMTATPSATPTATPHPMLGVTSPQPNAVVKSPLTVKGEARGNWYFEASFPVKLLDANGNQLAIIPAQAQGEWMTTNFVPFQGTLTFSTPTTATGTLVFEKDNPSGLPEHDDSYSIPVRFDIPQQNVKLYFYDPTKDNTMCTQGGLVSVNRTIPVTQTPIQDTIRLLLKGELTSAEKSQGLTTEYPLLGFELTSVSLQSGVLTLTFKDPQNKTSGGSCRVNILRYQIEATAKQFSGVNSVRFMPETLFQP